MKTYFIANWKMNKTLSEGRDFLNSFLGLVDPWPTDSVVGVAPQAIHLTSLPPLSKNTPLLWGAQNVSHEKSGALTGDISVDALSEAGVQFCLIAHSERRYLFKEPSEWFAPKITLCVKANIRPVYCIGETLEERNANRTFSVLSHQLEVVTKCGDISPLIIAYEPVWAIGTGVNASEAQIAEVHEFIEGWFKKSLLPSPPLLYGGSVKPSNARGILSQKAVHGLLVGGASLDAKSFAEIIQKRLV